MMTDTQKKWLKRLLPVCLCLMVIAGIAGIVPINATSELPKSAVNLGDSFTARIIYPKVNRYLAVHNENDIVTRTASTSKSQEWLFTKQSDGSYTIMNVKYKLYLDDAAGTGKTGADIQGTAAGDKDSQKWFIYSVNGRYIFKPVTSENCVLDIKNGSTEDLAQVQLYSYNESSAQLFDILKTSNTAGDVTETTTVNDGTTETKNPEQTTGQKPTSAEEETTEALTNEEETTQPVTTETTTTEAVTTETTAAPTTEAATTETTVAPTTTQKVEPTTEQPTTEQPTTEAPRVKEYYNEYNNVAAIKDKGSCGAMQGFAMGSTYAYCVKIKSDETSAVITKTHKDTGSTTYLTDTSTGSVYMNYLGHANDMCVTSLGGKSHLFIVTMKSGTYSFVKMKVDGSKVTKVGNYTLQIDGSNTSMSGVSILKQTDTEITFLFKKGSTIYKGTVGVNTNSGKIAVTKAYKLNCSSAKVNGTTTDISKYVHQGFFHYKNKLYVPLTGPSGKSNVSIILVYDLTGATASTSIKADDYLSFRITSSTYSALFEIESCGICSTDGKMYFNTNRRKSSSDTNHDAVLVFKKFQY